MDYRGALGLGGVREAGRRAGVEAVLGRTWRRQEPEAQVAEEDERGLAAAARRRVVVDAARPKPRLDGLDEWWLARDDRPRYCSVECQRAHWHAGHKDECPCVDEKKEIVDGNGWLEQLARERAKRRK